LGELNIIEIAQAFGLPGLVFIIWYWEKREAGKKAVQHQIELDQKRKEHQELLAIETEKVRHLKDNQKEIITTFQQNRDAILTQFEKYMAEMRQMYVNNASLVKNYQAMSADLKDAYILNSQSMTRLYEELRHRYLEGAPPMADKDTK